MRHGVKKIKFKHGKDANKMLMRKLLWNFIMKGKITTTIKKVKYLKSDVERLVEKAKVENEANKNQILRMIGDNRLLTKIFNEVGKSLKDKTGGYTRIIKLGFRESDGSEKARLEWVYPVVAEVVKPIEEKNIKIKNKK